MRADRRELAAIFAGGFVGAIARAEVGVALATPAGSWPWATFLVNIAGAALLGYFTTRLQERLPLSAYRRPFLGTGVCGALTTFSTMQIELLEMIDRGRWGLKLTAYFGERHKANGRFLADALVDIYERHALQTTTCGPTAC